MKNLFPNEVAVTNACAWSLMQGPSSQMLVMVYSDENSGQARVSCFSDAGMRKMSAEEFGFEHSLLTDIDRITDAELVRRLQSDKLSRDSEWNAGPWGETVANDLGIKYKKKGLQ